jgi:DNA-binding transcriptional MerR regulator/methylmalonyl-CoA mutase cobalamin-binding subunit
LPISDLPTYRIGAVARLTGLSEHLIRVWERRYQAVQPRRTDTGLREYSDADVNRLRLLKRATERGHAIGSVATLDDRQLDRIAGQPTTLAETRDAPPDAVSDELTASFVKAISAMDLSAAEEVIARADASLGSRATALGVLIPILHEVGSKWEAGQLSVAQEHAAAVVVRNYLGSAVRSLGRDEHAPTVLSCTPSGELHEFGALVAAVYAASHGLRVVYLGPNLPNEDLARAVRMLRARLVLLSAVARSRGLEASLAEIRAELPARVQIVVGGAAAGRLRQVPAGVARLERIEDLDPILERVRQSRR